MKWKRRWEEHIWESYHFVIPPLIFPLPVPELILSLISVTNVYENQLLVACFTRKLCKFRYSKFQFRLYLDPVYLQRWEWGYSVNMQLFELIWLPLFANISGTLGQILLKITLDDRVQLNLGKPHTTFADRVNSLLREVHMLFKHLPVKAGWKKETN